MATDELSRFSSEECLRKGLRLLKYTNNEIDRVCDCTNNERFSSHFGFPPEAVAAVLNDNIAIKPREFFMTLNWWKSYQEEHQMESRWKWHPETIRGKLYKVCRQLEERYDDKIIFDGFEEDQVYLSSIDCVHFRGRSV
jgi:hypothetical protein